ncbi:hypothetical protein BH09VER1_BH09VER1_39100 [soil metagenome]
MLRLLCFLLLAPIFSAAADSAVPSMERIRVDRKHRGFVDESGRPFVPFGVSYFRPHTGWAPQVWSKFDPEATRRDFALLKKIGANVVRVFLPAAPLWTAPDKLDPDALAKLDQFLDLADEACLYVHPTGPEGWEGFPPWLSEQTKANGGRGVGNAVYLQALQGFWTMLATHLRGRRTIWAYDLQNEPTVGWNTPILQLRWIEWRRQHNEPPAPVPDSKAQPPDPNLLEFQHLRESLAEEWVAGLSKAIHAADSSALVTIGLIQWSVPAQEMPLTQYSGFRPSLIARHLDFLELHYYPLVKGEYDYSSAELEKINLSVLESMARECARPGLPLVLAEFGWYGGGTYRSHTATEEQQAEWCRRLMEVTASLVCGWLNWGMYDSPDARDVSLLTGLFTADGQEKAWGRTFQELSNRYRTTPPIFKFPTQADLPWDACIQSPNKMDDFRQRYFEAFQRNIYP